MRVPFASAETLLPLTTFCAKFLNPRIVAFLLPVMVVVHTILWFHWSSGFRNIASHLQGIDLALLVFFNYAGLFAHELGHASACIRGGVRHGPLGFCVFLVFPGLFTDVTNAYRLPRTRRLLVDSGGVLVTLALASGTASLFLLTHWIVWKALTGVYTITAWVSLMPFVRMDGYWIISDILGIPSLSAVNRETSQWLLLRLLGKASTRPSIFLVHRAWIPAAYVLHCSVSLVFSVWLTWRIGKMYAIMLSHQVPTLAKQVVAVVLSRHPPHDIAGFAIRAAFVVLPLMTGGLFLKSRVAMLGRGLRSLRAAVKF